MEGAPMVPPSEADVWCLWRPTACPYVSCFHPSFFPFLPFSFRGRVPVPTRLTQVNSQPHVVLVPIISHLIGRHSTVAYPILSGSSTSASLKVFSRLVDLILHYAFRVSWKRSSQSLCLPKACLIPRTSHLGWFLHHLPLPCWVNLCTPTINSIFHSHIFISLFCVVIMNDNHISHIVSFYK